MSAAPDSEDLLGQYAAADHMSVVLLHASLQSVVQESKARSRPCDVVSSRHRQDDRLTFLVPTRQLSNLAASRYMNLRAAGVHFVPADFLFTSEFKRRCAIAIGYRAYAAAKLLAHLIDYRLDRGSNPGQEAPATCQDSGTRSTRNATIRSALDAYEFQNG